MKGKLCRFAHPNARMAPAPPPKPRDFIKRLSFEQYLALLARGEGTGQGGRMKPGETKLTKKVHEKVVLATRRGAGQDSAAAFAGIHRQTLARWLRRGQMERRRVAKQGGRAKGSDGACMSLCDALEKARADFEIQQLAIIELAARGQETTKTKRVTRPGGVVEETTEQSTSKSWQAAAWLLERRMPATYSRHVVRVDQDTDEAPQAKIINTPLAAPDVGAVEAKQKETGNVKNG